MKKVKITIEALVTENGIDELSNALDIDTYQKEINGKPMYDLRAGEQNSAVYHMVHFFGTDSHLPADKIVNTLLDNKFAEIQAVRTEITAIATIEGANNE